MGSEDDPSSEISASNDETGYAPQDSRGSGSQTVDVAQTQPVAEPAPSLVQQGELFIKIVEDASGKFLWGSDQCWECAQMLMGDLEAAQTQGKFPGWQFEVIGGAKEIRVLGIKVSQLNHNVVQFTTPQNPTKFTVDVFRGPKDPPQVRWGTRDQFFKKYRHDVSTK